MGERGPVGPVGPVGPPGPPGVTKPPGIPCPPICYHWAQMVTFAPNLQYMCPNQCSDQSGCCNPSPMLNVELPMAPPLNLPSPPLPPMSPPPINLGIPVSRPPNPFAMPPIPPLTSACTGAGCTPSLDCHAAGCSRADIEQGQCSIEKCKTPDQPPPPSPSPPPPEPPHPPPPSGPLHGAPPPCPPGCPRACYPACRPKCCAPPEEDLDDLCKRSCAPKCCPSKSPAPVINPQSPPPLSFLPGSQPQQFCQPSCAPRCCVPPQVLFPPQSMFSPMQTCRADCAPSCCIAPQQPPLNGGVGGMTASLAMPMNFMNSQTPQTRGISAAPLTQSACPPGCSNKCLPLCTQACCSKR